MTSKKLSIIIPIYNTEKYLRKCLNSVLKQTYSNLEIILVNDCSTDNSKKIIEEYCKKDSRFKCVNNPQNLGLFKTRVAGSRVATGDFIAFLDSDDYITVDHYRLLINNLENNKSDMVVGDTILEWDDGKKIKFSISDMEFDILQDEEIMNSYFSQNGLNFSWHTIWNKVYTMDLWKKAFPHYEKIKTHLIMAEDFAFSTVLFYYASKITRVQNGGVYYCQHTSGSSTSLSGLTSKKMLKNIGDLIQSFDFAEEFMKEVNIYDKYKDNFLLWKKLYRNQQETFLKMAKLSTKESKEVQNKIVEFCNKKEKIDKDNYFSSIQTDWNPKLEKLKQSICNSKIEYISFDIFDTLVVRPFLKPTDLFILLDKDFRELSNNTTGVDFSKMRVNAEKQARDDMWNKHKQEEITLDDIYNTLVTKFNVQKSVANKMKKLEKEYEIRFCNRRNTAFELYEMALTLNKKIICTSDMYLPLETINKILKKNGYTKIEKVYLSSELKVTKSSGNLYKYVKNDLNISGNHIIHIGDNFTSDYTNAKANGLDACQLMKTTDVFFNKKITNNLGQIFIQDLPDWQDNLSAMNFLGVRVMLSIVANKYFDNPFRSFNKYTDFNADPYLMGYYALGMHLFGVSKWLIDSVKDKEYDSISFMARDGYLPMEAYKILKPLYKNIPDEKYLYISRKASIPFIVQKEYDIYKLSEVISWYNNTPIGILKYIHTIFDIDQEKLTNICNRQNIDLNSKFTNESQLYEFLSILSKEFFDEKKHEKKLEILKSYFDSILNGKACVFDVGYSARPELFLSELCKKKIDTFFININHEEAIKHSEIEEFNLQTFYDYKPKFTGLLREILFSKCSPSCIEYKIENNKVVPFFENYSQTYQEKFLINTIQGAALDFVNDVVKIFGEDINRLYYQKYYISMPYEMLVQSSNHTDRRVMDCIIFEDDIRNSSSISVTNQWVKEMKWHNQHSIEELFTMQPISEYGEVDLSNRSKMIKLVYYTLIDRTKLKEKVKYKLQNHKVMYNFSKKSYGLIRKMKNDCYKYTTPKKNKK